MSRQIVLTTQCCDCGVDKHFSKYDVARDRHLNPRCRPCGSKFYYANKPKQTTEEKAAYMRAYYIKNKEKADAVASEWRRSKRVETILALGGRCAACGEDDLVVLDIDHINNNGAAERKATGCKNVVFLVRRSNYDKSVYQVLCKNCNWRKEHKRRKNAIDIKTAA